MIYYIEVEKRMVVDWIAEILLLSMTEQRMVNVYVDVIYELPDEAREIEMELIYNFLLFLDLKCLGSDANELNMERLDHNSNWLSFPLKWLTRNESVWIDTDNWFIELN